jgi:transposase
MRYELSDFEWAAIKPFLPNKPRGVRRVNDRRLLNDIFWVLRSGAPWRDLPATYGPRTTCCNMLMGIDEAGTLARLKGLRRDLIDPQIAAHSGRGNGVSNRDQDGGVNHKRVGKLVVRDIRRQAA